MRLLIIFIGFLYICSAQAEDLLTVENIYVSAEDYNSIKAKDKAFKEALKRAAKLALEENLVQLPSNNWKLSNLVVSYRVHGEQIESAKYSAYFDFTFDMNLLRSALKERSDNKVSKGRIIYLNNKKNKLFESWVESLASDMNSSAVPYQEVDEIYKADILIIPSLKDNGNFLLSIETGSNIYNFTAENFASSFIEMLQYVSLVLKEKRIKNSNIIFLKIATEAGVNKKDLYDRISRATDLNSVNIVSYGVGAIPKFAIDISEKDDLFITYVYNAGDYVINDLNLFEQLM